MVWHCRTNMHWIFYERNCSKQRPNTFHKGLANAKRPCDCSAVGWWIFNTSWMPTTVSEKSSWSMRPWGLATCITGPLSHVLACNGWSAARAQPTPLVEIDAFRTGVGHFQRIFRVERTIPSNRRCSGKTRYIPISCGVEILTDDYFVLSHYTHLTDGRKDRQNCDSNTVCCITCSRVVIKRMSYLRHGGEALQLLSAMADTLNMSLKLCTTFHSDNFITLLRGNLCLE